MRQTGDGQLTIVVYGALSGDYRLEFLDEWLSELCRVRNRDTNRCGAADCALQSR